MTHAAMLLLALVAQPHYQGEKAPANDGKGEWTWEVDSKEKEGGYWWRYQRTVTEAAETPMQAVNAARARRGLPPFVEDPLLSKSAQACAEYRAARLMAGHTPNDFGFLVPGAYANAAGCAAWPVSMGWGSCCTYENHRYAGAGWAMGRDGQRYMHLFVR